MINFNALSEDESLPSTTTNSLDHTSAIERLKVLYLPRFEEMAEAVKSFKITDTASLTQAVEMGSQAKNIFKSLEKARKNEIADADNFVREINKFCKGFKDRLDIIDKDLSQKVQFYKNQIELERRKKEEDQRKFLEEQKIKMEAEAKKANIPMPEIIIPAQPVVAPARKIITNTGSQAVERKAWTFDIEDFALIPDKYKEIVRAAVMNDIRAGIRIIPGLKIYQETKTNFK